MGCNCGGKSMRAPTGGMTSRPGGSHAPSTAPNFRNKAQPPAQPQTVQSAGLMAKRAILTTQHAATRRQV